MKLKKLLEGFAWERKPGQPLPTLKDTTKAHSLKEANGQGFDYDYHIGQVEAAQEAITAVEEELIRTLDMLAEDEQVYGLVSDAAEQAANQARRYVAGAEKQLEGLQNMLERAKRQKSFDA
jgi:predicted outer membrane protein